MNYIIISEDALLSRQLVTAAKEQGAATVTAIAFERETADMLAQTGIDRVVCIELPVGALKESAASLVAEQASAFEEATVLVGQSKRMFNTAALVAHKLGTAPVSDVQVLEGGAASHPMYGGAINVLDKACGSYAVYVIPLGAYEAAPLDQEAVAVEQHAVAALAGIQVVAEKPKEEESVDISAAKRIVCVGRGVNDSEGFDECVALSQALGAEMACSRPYAEKPDTRLSKEVYVGSTGNTVKPDLYVGVAVSGQTQHFMGMYKSGTIVVVNSSKDAPFFRQCDYGLVGDYREIVPAIAKALA